MNASETLKCIIADLEKSKIRYQRKCREAIRIVAIIVLYIFTWFLKREYKFRQTSRQPCYTVCNADTSGKPQT